MYTVGNYKIEKVLYIYIYILKGYIIAFELFLKLVSTLWLLTYYIRLYSARHNKTTVFAN